MEQQTKNAESAFVTGLSALTTQQKANQLHGTVQRFPQFVEVLKKGIEEIKANKKSLGSDLDQLTSEGRIAVLGVGRVDQLTTDPQTLRDIADALISEGHRLKAVADQPLCEDWLETQLTASVEELAS